MDRSLRDGVIGEDLDEASGAKVGVDDEVEEPADAGACDQQIAEENALIRSHARPHLHVAHAVFVAVVGGGAIALAARVYGALPDAPRGRVGGWMLVALVLVLVGIGLGAFEGFYNHVVKKVLFFGGASTPTMHRLYPPPAYELPDDAIFELTGIAQAIPALLAAIAAIRLGARLLRHETPPGALTTD